MIIDSYVHHYSVHLLDATFKEDLNRDLGTSVAPRPAGSRGGGL